MPDGIFERTMHINWLEPSEVYTVGNEDNNNPPQCILDIALNGGSGWWEIYPKSKRGATPEKLGSIMARMINVRTMMINRRVPKLDSIDLARQWHDFCFNKLRKKSRAFPESNFAQVVRFLDTFISIDSLQRRQCRVARWRPCGSILDVWKSRIANSANRQKKKTRVIKLTRSYAYEILQFEAWSNVVSFSNEWSRNVAAMKYVF